MADDTPRSLPSPRQEGQGRPPRQGDHREPGGFRIRLSDNEMQAARALQEAFGLRSTVAVLGFALRTLAQQLEAGQLDALVEQQRAQARERPQGGRGGERRGPRDDRRGGGGDSRPQQRANPFARPSRPAAPAPEPEPDAALADASDAVDAAPLADDEALSTAAETHEAPAVEASSAAEVAVVSGEA